MVIEHIEVKWRLGKHGWPFERLSLFLVEADDFVDKLASVGILWVIEDQQLLLILGRSLFGGDHWCLAALAGRGRGWSIWPRTVGRVDGFVADG